MNIKKLGNQHKLANMSISKPKLFFVERESLPSSQKLLNVTLERSNNYDERIQLKTVKNMWLPLEDHGHSCFRRTMKEQNDKKNQAWKL